MWTLLAGCYAAGFVATALILRQTRAVETGRVVETTCSVLWPVYWTFLGFCICRNLRRR